MLQGQSAGRWEATGRDEPGSDRAVMGMGTAVITSRDFDSYKEASYGPTISFSGWES